MRHDINKEKLEYVRNLFAPEDDNLKKISVGLSESEMGMQVGADEGKLLSMFVSLIKAKKIVELGVLSGYSSIWMARAMEADGMIYAVEQDKRRFDIIENNYKACGVASKTTLCKGAALDVLPSLCDKGPFDMIFIDADKANYANYLDWAEKNVRKGGLIIGDNSFLFDNVYKEYTEELNVGKDSWLAMREFNKRLADNTKYISMLLPTEEGMTVAIKNF